MITWKSGGGLGDMDYGHHAGWKQRNTDYRGVRARAITARKDTLPAMRYQVVKLVDLIYLIRREAVVHSSRPSHQTLFQTIRRFHSIEMIYPSNIHHVLTRVVEYVRMLRCLVPVQKNQSEALH